VPTGARGQVYAVVKETEGDDNGDFLSGVLVAAAATGAAGGGGGVARFFPTSFFFFIFVSFYCRPYCFDC
jgi:hypothetical protein